MNLKTFTAATMPEALMQVKRTMGPDAVILHTRTYKRGGILGIGARQVVEITAGSGAGIGAARSRRRPASRQPAASRAAATRPTAAPAPAAAAATRADDEPLAGDLIRRTYAAARSELAMAHAAAMPAQTSAHAAGVALSGPVTAPIVAGDQLAREMQAVKAMVARMLRQQRQRDRKRPRRSGGSASPDVAAAGLPAKLFDQYLALLEQEVADELADQIIADVHASLSHEQLQDEQAVRVALLEAIARYVPSADDAGQVTPTPDGRPRTIALIGPTGVGKTTTIAKLAANFKLKQKRKVGLITLDTYRIAAVEQLRTYANIIGVKLHVVVSPEELIEAMRQCAGCDVVLMDTAGRSQRDDPKLDQLSTFIRAADPHEVHLVLSSTCTQGVMLDAVERFSRIRTDRIIFTKLDEAVTFGVMLNVASQVNKRLSYMTTGQEVPHDIEPGRPQRLAELLLGPGT